MSSPLPERLYYDVLVSNLTNKETKPPRATFSQTRSTPFLLKPDEYFMSIVRWTLDTTTLPIFRPTIKPDSDDPNQTIYSITLQHGGVKVKTFMTFIPQDKSADVAVSPATRGGLQDNSTGYYDIYSYSHVIFLVNNTLKEAFANLKELTALPTDVCPFVSFDTATKVAVMNCDKEGFGSSAEGGPIEIFFNTALGGLFNSFPYEISNNSGDGRNFKLQVDVLGDSTVFPAVLDGTDVSLIQVFQEYSTVSSWNPVMSLAVMSNTLGIVQNIESKPTIFLNGNIVYGSGNNSVSSNLITDFVADDYRPNIIYVPSAEYRRIELVGSEPLSNLDLSIYWKTREGEFVPFLLPSGGSCSIKIMFEKKH